MHWNESIFWNLAFLGMLLSISWRLSDIKRVLERIEKK
jgi:hypothetical protein